MTKYINMLLMLLLSFLFCSCGKLQSSPQLIKADTAYNQGNFKKSIEILKRLIEEDPTRPEYYHKLGVAYFSDGRKADAQQQVEELQKMGQKDLANDLKQLIK